MQEAHNRVLVFKGAGFHNGAGQDFDQPAADGINDDADHDADERIREQIRKEGQARQAEAGSDLGKDHAAPVADGIHETGAENVHQQLRQKKSRRDQCNLPQGDGIIRMEFQEQQGSEVRADRLGYKREVAGQQGFPIVPHSSLRTEKMI